MENFFLVPTLHIMYPAWERNKQHSVLKLS